MLNLHTHTYRCRHAEGADRAYVEAAIEAGYDTMGFSDHAPILFPPESGYYSNFRMKPEELEGYVQSVLDLRREYAADIRIYLGLELEYYPALFEKTLAFICRYPMDYLIQGQHFLDNEYETGAPYSGHPTGDPAVLRGYVRQVLEGLATGAFTYLAHPDLLNFTGDREIYSYEMERLCRGAKELGIPLELNFLGFRTGRHYPNSLFWEVARRVGNDIVVGLDAHAPDTYLDRKGGSTLQRWMQKQKLAVTDSSVVLRDPHAALH